MPKNYNKTIFKKYQLLILISATFLLSSCGNDYPKLTQFKAFDERFNTVIDTKDSAELKEFSELFFSRTEADDALDDLNFNYLIDITTTEGSQRWRCSENGYCQERKQGATPHREIFFLERYKELYTKANLN